MEPRKTPRRPENPPTASDRRVGISAGGGVFRMRDFGPNHALTRELALAVWAIRRVERNASHEREMLAVTVSGHYM